MSHSDSPTAPQLRWARYLGFSEKELLGKTRGDLYDLIHNEADERRLSQRLKEIRDKGLAPGVIVRRLDSVETYPIKSITKSGCITLEGRSGLFHPEKFAVVSTQPKQ